MLAGNLEIIITVFFLCFGLHLLIDFGFQGVKEVFEKEGLNRYMLWHALKTSLAILPALVCFSLIRVVLGFFILFISHVLIDNFRLYFLNQEKIDFKEQSWWLWLGLDQILHLSVFWLLFLFWLK